MADISSWTPYLAAGFAAILAWLCKSAMQCGRDIVKIQTVIQYYVERQTKDAAVRLETVSNPTPPEMQLLLKKYRLGKIDDAEFMALKGWLKSVPDDPNANPAERSAALQMLTGLKTDRKIHEALFQSKKPWWHVWG